MIEVIEFNYPKDEPELGVEIGWYELLGFVDIDDDLDYVDYGIPEVDKYIIQVFNEEVRWTYILVDKGILRLIHKGKN